MGQIVNRRRVFGGGGIDYSKQYLTFVSLADNNEIKFFTNDDNNTRTISVSTDKYTWASKTSSSAGTLLETLNNGGKLYVKVSVNLTGYSNGTYYHHFEATGDFALQGNIMSLLYGDNFIGQTALPSGYAYTFSRLFEYCRWLVNIDNLVLPATTLVEYCYSSMFSGCSSLVTAPKLSATLLAPYCYRSMFSDCTSLMNVPNDYLPATALANGCYQSMFFNCYSLTIAPQLPATRLASFCYQQMFYNCRSLSAIGCMATNISASACTYQWVKGVSADGIFLKPSSMSSWTTGIDGIPSGWTVQNA